MWLRLHGISARLLKSKYISNPKIAFFFLNSKFRFFGKLVLLSGLKRFSSTDYNLRIVFSNSDLAASLNGLISDGDKIISVEVKEFSEMKMLQCLFEIITI